MKVKQYNIKDKKQNRKGDKPGDRVRHRDKVKETKIEINLVEFQPSCEQ